MKSRVQFFYLRQMLFQRGLQSITRTNALTSKISIQTRCLFKKLFPTDPRPTVFLQTLGDESLDVRRQTHRWIEMERLLLNAGNQSSDGVGLVWAISVQHFVQDNSHRPNISINRVGFAPQNLWSHIKRRPQHGASHILDSEFFAETKISQLENALFDQYILRFQISVHDAVLPQHFQALQKLTKYFQSSLLLQSPFLFEQIVQRPSLAVLINKIAIIFCLKQLVELDDVRTRLQDIVNGQFVVDALFNFFVVGQNLITDDFHCEQSAIIKMPRLENLTVGPLSQQVPQLVSTHHSPHLHLPDPGAIFHQNNTCYLQQINNFPPSSSSSPNQNQFKYLQLFFPITALSRYSSESSWKCSQSSVLSYTRSD